MRNPLFSSVVERLIIVSLPLFGLWAGVVALG